MDAPRERQSAVISTPSSEGSRGGARASIVEICGKYTSKCGYCKSAGETSVSFGIVAKHLTCDDYQALIDRGWRRSGNFVYKPINHETCCPQYTIRLDVNAFQPSKSQRQALSKLSRFLVGSANPAALPSAARDSPAGSPPAVIVKGHKTGALRSAGASGAVHGGRDGSPKYSEASRSSSAQQGKLPKSKEPAAVTGEDRTGWPLPKALVDAAAGLTKAVLAAVSEAGAVGALPLPAAELLPEKLGGAAQVKPSRQAALGDYSCAIALKLAHLASRARGKQEALAHPVGGAAVTAPRAEDSSASTAAQNVCVAVGQISNGVSQKGAKKWAPADVAAVLARFLQREVGDGAQVVAADNGFINFWVGGGGGGGGSGSSVGTGGTGPTAATDAAAPAVFTRAAHTGANGGTEAVTGASAGAAGEGRRHSKGKGKGKEKAAGACDPPGTLGGRASAMAVDSSDGSRAWHDNGIASSVRMQPPGSVRRAAMIAETQPADSSLDLERHLTVETVLPCVTDEVFTLYRTYQHRVHGDDPEEMQPESFRRFLVDSPLLRKLGGGGGGGGSLDRTYGSIYGSRGGGAGWDGSERGSSAMGAAGGRVAAAVAASGVAKAAGALGTYHQLYRLDGRLVAVGVVDVLPNCLSSVYCFYDPEWRALSLGRVVALSEIEWLRQAQVVRPSLHFYYLGYYIHSCPKMSYKGTYHPSQLLCPVRYSWEPLEKCRGALDVERYVVLSDVRESSTSDEQNSNARDGRDGGGDGYKMEESDGRFDGTEHCLPAAFKKRLRSPQQLNAADACGGSGGDGSGGGKGSPQTVAAEAGGAAGSGPNAVHSAAYSSPATEPMRDDSDAGEGEQEANGGDRRGDAAEEDEEDGESDEGCGVPFLPPPPPASASPSETAAHARAGASVPSIPLLVAPGTLVDFDLLTPRGQAMLWPVLAEYADMVGPELAGRMLIKLHR